MVMRILTIWPARKQRKGINEEVQEDHIACCSDRIGHCVIGIAMFGNQLGINVMEYISPYFSDICLVL